MKKFLKHRALCPTFISVLSDILNNTSDILNIINYYFILFPRTSCPSDMEVKTSDMSGCPMTFRLHCTSNNVFSLDGSVYPKDFLPHRTFIQFPVLSIIILSVPRRTLVKI